MRLSFLFLIITFVSQYGAERLCPETCKCKTNAASCESWDFTPFGQDVLELKLRNIAKPIKIQSGAFSNLNLQHLQVLAFENVTIEHIDPAAFKDFDRLRQLSFTNSTLPVLVPETFVLAPYLQVLNIDNCELKGFDALKSESIQILKLSQCKLAEITENTFINLPELTDVDLSNNEIVKIDPKAFLTLYYLEDVNLMNNKIASLPSGIFKENLELAVLDLSGNPINKLNSSDLSSIEKLVLKNCNLKEFKGDFPELGYLDLSNNKISELNSATFGGMPDLEYLDLSSNQLETLPSDIFANNTRLQKIYLDSNEFEILPKFTSKETFATYYFSCNDCGLENIEENIFEMMPSIIILNLAGNRLQTFNPKIIDKVKNRLHTLDISYNMITSLSLDTFEKITLLTNLNLAGNNLAYLDPSLFKNNKGLKSLDISNNNLKQIWKPAIGQLPSVEVMNLADNRLEAMTKAELEVTPNLKVLNLNNNSFNCSKELDEAIRWLNSNMVEPSSWGTHSEYQESVVHEKVELERFWKNLCTEDDDAFDEDIAEAYDEEEDEDDEDEDEDEDVDVDGLDIHAEIDIDEYHSIIAGDRDEVMRVSDDEVYTESMYRTKYSFLWPLLVFIFTALLVLLLVSNIILCVLRKRGNLPRNINLTWQKGNGGFVYKPLTEELPRAGSIIINGVDRHQTQNL